MAKAEEALLVAKRRIQEAKETKSSILDLSDLGIEQFPDSLFELTWIERLNLKGNRISVIPTKINKLEKLLILNLSQNCFANLPNELTLLNGLGQLDISDNKITSLPSFLVSMKNLYSLNANNLTLSELPDFLADTRLIFLHVDNNQIKEVPESFRNSRISHFFLNNNKISKLPRNISLPAGLYALSISNNHIYELPSWLEKLSGMHHLNAESNRLQKLPRSLKNIPHLETLLLNGNDSLGLPPEILGPTWIDLCRSKKPAPRPADILDYYFRVRRARRPLNEAKVILVGRGAVGKTSLIKRLNEAKFDPDEKETQGIEINSWRDIMPCGEQIHLHVWDFGGQEILHATHQFFLTERTLYLLVLSGREGGATEDAEYWLELLSSFIDNSPVLIVLNKHDTHSFDVDRERLLEKHPAIVGFAETDCKTDLGIAELKNRILKLAESLEHRKSDFPADWFDIKDRLAGMEDNFLSWERYQEICREHGEVEAAAQRRLAGFLHVLGIALNYQDDPRLKDTAVLNPRWVTEGIYALLRACQRSPRGAVLIKADLSTALDKKHYPTERHDFLLRLMERFLLCFRLPGKEDRYLVPDLLGENQPDIRALLKAPGLGFQYKLSVLPAGMLPRFIVQTHKLSSARPEFRWRNGVVLEADGCQAVVRADRRDRRIDIHVIGPEAQRRGLLAIIRERFAEQFQELKGLNVEAMVPIPGMPGKTVSYDDLVMREMRGENSFFPPLINQLVFVQQLLNGVDVSAQPRRQRLATERREIPAPIAEIDEVFIGYSNCDSTYFEELLVHLKPLERVGALSKWSEQDIRPGESRQDAVEAALRRARVAVLLLSPDFLASDFLYGHVLEPLEAKAKQGKAQILWVLLRHCSYKDTVLAPRKPALPLSPLADMPKYKRDEAWVKLTDEINKMIQVSELKKR